MRQAEGTETGKEKIQEGSLAGRKAKMIVEICVYE